MDDHEDTVRAFVFILERRGFNVTTAHSVASALTESAESTFDFLICDLGLPDGHGHEIITAMKANQNIYGIALSGFGMEADVRASLEAGFDAHVVKPVTASAIMDAIAKSSVRGDIAGGN